MKRELRSAPPRCQALTKKTGVTATHMGKHDYYRHALIKKIKLGGGGWRTKRSNLIKK